MRSDKPGILPLTDAVPGDAARSASTPGSA